MDARIADRARRVDREPDRRVVSAGYTVMRELPILLVIFGGPALVAWLLARRFGGTRSAR